MNNERMIAVSSDLIERAISLLDLLPESGTIIELRAALATQPAAGEPIGKIVSFAPRLHEVSWHKGKLPPLGTELYAAPPASAHGDEAARKDAAAAYVDMSCNSVLIDGATCYYLPAERMAAFDRMFSLGDAMRAQGDDRLLFTDAIMPGGMTET